MCSSDLEIEILAVSLCVRSSVSVKFIVAVDDVSDVNDCERVGVGGGVIVVDSVLVRVGIIDGESDRVFEDVGRMDGE